MYLSNKEFVKRYFDNISQIDEIINLFEIIIFLVKKLGKKVFLSLYLKKLQDINIYLAQMILLLKKLGKLNVNDLNIIIMLLKNKYPNYRKDFLYNGDDRIFKEVELFLKEKFKNIYLDKQKDEKLKLFVKGEGFYFKKSLSNDINKILKIN